MNAADAGGGRIAIHYDPAAQAALAKPVPDVTNKKLSPLNIEVRIF